MTTSIFNVILGHLIGDYLLQNNWMALNKSKYLGLGWLVCFIHCMLYTFSVCLLTTFLNPLWIIGVFLSHFLIDKFGIAEKYLKFINGRSIQQFLINEENREYTPYIGLRAGITVFVFVVVDNTIHLLLMSILWWKLFKTF